MTKADIVLIIIAMLGAYGGYKEGFLMEMFSLAAVILGVFCGFKLMGMGMIFLEERFNADRSTLPYISFGIIFLIVVVVVRLLGRIIRSSVDKSFLGNVDQAMGAGLGAVRSLFLVSILLWIVDSLRISPSTEWTDGSWLYPFTAKLAPTVAEWVGKVIPPFKEIFPVF